jgi:hypothetical protein
VLLPWHRQGHPRTGLNRRCAAVCGWIAQIRPTDVREVGGVVPGAFMVEILRRVQAGALEKRVSRSMRSHRFPLAILSDSGLARSRAM